MIFHHDNVAVISRISDERTGAADMMHETTGGGSLYAGKGVVMRIAWERP